MSIEIKKTSRWWYARIVPYPKAKPKLFNLGVEVKGKRPARITQKGDDIFERSRAVAMEKHESLMSEIRAKRGTEKYIRKLFEIRSGGGREAVSLRNLPDAWENAPRRKRGSERYRRQAKAILRKFVGFISKHYGYAESIADITAPMCAAFMEDISRQGISGRTYNAHLVLLRSAFKILGALGSLASNPFALLPTREEHTLHRQPFSQEDLQRILQVVADDDLLRPAIVTAICTAMRRGDCCRLRWDAVDLHQEFVLVKTSKTGELVEIPLFPALRDEISKMQGQACNSESPYIWPELAMMYNRNPQGVTYRVQKLLLQAGFVTATKDGKKPTRDEGQRRASIYDFHSFRTTWITLALSAGIPEELVRRVTGHRSLEIVLRHYFRPGRTEFRAKLMGSLPAALMGEGNSRKDEALSLLARMTADSFDAERDQLRLLIDRI